MKQMSNSFIFVKEGFKTVLFIAVFTGLVLLLSDAVILKLLALVILAASLFLFRNPERVLEHFESSAIMSVCDGIISNIETLDCSGKIKGECLKISITNRFIDASVLRVPFDANFALNEIKRGAQLASHSGKAMALNEQAKVMFTHHSDQANKMVVKHYLNRFNLPISLSPTVGEQVEIASPYGFILHGTILVFLPASARLDIKKGDEVKAGETILGYFTK